MSELPIGASLVSVLNGDIARVYVERLPNILQLIADLNANCITDRTYIAATSVLDHEGNRLPLAEALSPLLSVEGGYVEIDHNTFELKAVECVSDDGSVRAMMKNLKFLENYGTRPISTVAHKTPTKEEAGEMIKALQRARVYAYPETTKEEEAAALWVIFSKVPVLDDEIQEPFLHFDKGTDRIEILKWFEVSMDFDVAAALGLGDNHEQR